jgi:signal transduction histidine kinase
VEIALFRVLQESLTNAHRHSGASEVNVSFLRRSETAILEVRDFGRGIPPERLARLRETSADTGVGLAGMRERMNELSGAFEIESNAQGTTVRATVPLSEINQRKMRRDCRQFSGLITNSPPGAVVAP